MLSFLGTWNERARDCLQDLLGWDFGPRGLLKPLAMARNRRTAVQWACSQLLPPSKVL